MTFLTVIFFLSLLSAVLSASETALTAASRIRLHQMDKKGLRHAHTVLSLQKNMGQVIATLLLANTVVITSIAALSTVIFTRLFGEAGAFYAAAITSTLITIYLEVMPKVFVYERAESVAIQLAPFIYYLQRFLMPLTRLVEAVARGSLKILGLGFVKTQSISALEDLQGAIDLHTEGTTATRERRMLRNILDLTHVTVGEVMVHKGHMFSLNVEKPAPHLIEQILASPFTRIPLWKGNKETICGLLHVKELYRALQKTDPKHLNLEKIMAEPWFIPETRTLIQQLQAFKERQAHFAFVIDEYGHLAGIVTLEDVLEEIVGDIKDEHDEPLTGVTPFGQDSFLVEGSVTLRDLSREHNWNLPETSATTLAGLVMDVAGYIPKENQTLTIHNLNIKIVKRQRNQLKLLQVWLPKEPKLPASDQE